MTRSLRNSHRSQGFTLIEMLTVVAGMVIVSGLMISLARHVRASSAQEGTQRILTDLAAAVEQYMTSFGQAPPIIAGLTPTGEVQEQEVQSMANRNSNEVLRMLRPRAITHDFLATLTDSALLRDAWGSSIIYLPSMHPQLGMAPGDKPFFVSAGPDRKFLTREDNLYSYE